MIAALRISSQVYYRISYTNGYIQETSGNNIVYCPEKSTLISMGLMPANARLSRMEKQANKDDILAMR